MKYISGKYTYKGVTADLTWIPSKDYKNFKPIKQVYGFCFNKKGQLLTIKSPHTGMTQVPGGTVEPNEDPIDTLTRELDEEANVDLKDIAFLGVQKVKVANEVYYQARFAANIKKLRRRELDPADNIIVRRRFINPYDFPKRSGWGKIGQAIVELAIEKRSHDSNR
jgi:8-oxo-dGTP pyrophosphatase MutT (NUDIX family)